MRCDEVRRFVDLYIDSEFDERERVLFAEHLCECAACRLETSSLASFRTALRHKLKPQKMPAEIRGRLAALALTQADVADKRSRLTLPAAIAASMLLAVAASALYLQFVHSPSDELSRIVEQSVAAHEASLPPEVQGSDDRSRGFLADQVGTDPSPPLREDDSTRLVGARLTHIGPSKAILFRYLHRGHNVSVVRLPRSIDLASLPRVNPRDSRVLFNGDRNGHSVTLYERPGHTDTVVADLPAPEVLKLIPASL